jgi:4-hydroxy-4-methyl-2-oxoglutarate aldolase
MKEKIIELIKKNRISSVEVADALGKSGVLAGPKPLSTGQHVVGEVQYIYGHSESNWPIHKQGENINEGGILYVDTFECNDKAAFGDIVAKYFLLYKQVEGVVVNGLLRDVHTLKKENYPIWCKGITPLGCYNKDVEETLEISNQVRLKKLQLEGSIMVCDDSGCTVISKNRINEDTYNRLEFIELQEDIWFYCLDTLKWSTYKTICEKAYLKDKDVLPQVLKDRLKKYE